VGGHHHEDLAPQGRSTAAPTETSRQQPAPARKAFKCAAPAPSNPTSGSGCCRASGRVAHRKGAGLSVAADHDCRSVRRGRGRRCYRAYDRRAHTRVKSGKLRPLAVTTAVRSEVLPDIPTVGEYVPGYEAYNPSVSTATTKKRITRQILPHSARDQRATIFSCGRIARLIGRRARIDSARLDTDRPPPCPGQTADAVSSLCSTSRLFRNYASA
jgi:hypothetical protein